MEQIYTRFDSNTGILLRWYSLFGYFFIIFSGISTSSITIGELCGFAGDSHGTMEKWKASGEDIPTLHKKINAVIQKINDNGKERYILMEYIS